MGSSGEHVAMNSAEKPVVFETLRDCQAWLGTFTPLELSAQPPLQRLSTALSYLRAPPSRKKNTTSQRHGECRNTHALRTQGNIRRRRKCKKSWRQKSFAKQQGSESFSFEDLVLHRHPHPHSRCLLWARLSVNPASRGKCCKALPAVSAVQPCLW